MPLGSDEKLEIPYLKNNKGKTVWIKYLGKVGNLYIHKPFRMDFSNHNPFYLDGFRISSQWGFFISEAIIQREKTLKLILENINPFDNYWAGRYIDYKLEWIASQELYDYGYKYKVIYETLCELDIKNGNKFIYNRNYDEKAQELLDKIKTA